MYKNCFKRVIDFTLVFFVLITIWPILLVITVWLHFSNKGAGAFFFQERPGLNGKIFKVIKYKTMTDEKDSDGKLLPDAQRLTKVGSFVRSTSIDELPQLLNVLRGDMALIGPRPLLVKYLPFYTEREQLRHSVRPGITGWAQVNGRNNLEWDERLEHDAYYAEHLSFVFDMKILYMTVVNVLKGSDITVAPSESHDLDVIRSQKKTNLN
ncbi:MAG: sugar transferase [Prevotellaceae bacterium]|nr:sugar transferase [Candidatus Minthosoma caballi]